MSWLGFAARQPARILIVDDEADGRALFEIILLREGFLIATAESGAEALAAVADVPPDLILLDVMLGDMTGYEVAAELKRNVATRHIPIIMLSAMNDEATVIRAHNAGAEAFLVRPVNRIDLCHRVNERLLRPPVEGEAPRLRPSSFPSG